jgi:hypothetical protein
MKKYNKIELEQIKKFKKLVELVFIGPKGNLIFNNEDFTHDASYSDLHQDSDLPFLMEKMNSMLILINNDPELVDKDLEEELWNRC